MDRRDPRYLAKLMSSAATRDAGDGGPLAELVSRCWPGGGDRSDPVALDWVRRWGPHRANGPVAVCACAERACVVCN